MFFVSSYNRNLIYNRGDGRGDIDKGVRYMRKSKGFVVRKIVSLAEVEFPTWWSSFVRLSLSHVKSRKMTTLTNASQHCYDVCDDLYIPFWRVISI